MTEKRFVLVKCVEHYWGIVDKSLENIDQLVLMHMNKTSVSYIVNVLNQLTEENEQLKRQNEHLSNIIECLEKGSCRSIDSFIDSYCTDELLNEYGLNEDDLFYGDVE